MTTLFEKLDGGLTGIRLYGIAPPKLASEAERLREIAAQQVARLRMLAPDGLVVYDIQDEPGRSGQARPFPFLPTVDADAYAYDALADLAIPKIVYRCVGAHPREVFSRWTDTVRPNLRGAERHGARRHLLGAGDRHTPANEPMLRWACPKASTSEEFRSPGAVGAP